MNYSPKQTPQPVPCGNQLTKTSDTESAVNAMEHAVSKLETTIESLETRLGPVLLSNNHTPPPESESDTMISNRCRLGDSIRTQAGRIEAVCMRGANIIDRLGV